MIESLLGYILLWPVLAVIAILAVFSDHNDRTGWALIFGIISTIIAVKLFGPFNRDYVIWAAWLYVPVGCVWSFWRYKRWCDVKVVEVKKSLALRRRTSAQDSVAFEAYKAESLREIGPTNNIGRITYWILVWPISMVSSVLSDIINLVERLVRDVLKKIYSSIYNSAVKEIE